MLSYTGASVCLLLYAFLGIARFSVLRTKLPAFVPFGYGCFIFLYVLDAAFHLIEQNFRPSFELSGTHFNYSSVGLNSMLSVIFGYILIVEFALLVTVIGFRIVAKQFSTLSDTAPFGTTTKCCTLFVAGGICFAFIWRIQSTIGFVQFLQSNALRPIVFDGLGVLLALHFALVLFLTLALVISTQAMDRLFWGILFAGTSFVTVARWPILVLVANYLVVVSYRTNTSILRFRNLVLAGGVVAVFLVIVVTTRPLGESDFFGYPIGLVFGSGQVPQASNIIVITTSADIDGALQSHAWLFLGDLLPDFVRRVFGIQEAIPANTIFTMALDYERIRNTGSEISLGGLNEVYFGYGIVVLAIVAIVVPIAAVGSFRMLASLKAANTTLIIAFDVSICWCLFQFMRSDLSHLVGRVIPILLFLFGILIATTVKLKLRRGFGK